jgi:hypothetical protein
MRRQRGEAYTQSILARAGEGVLDIPDLNILTYAKPDTLLASFEAAWGKPPAAIALPVTSNDGVLFRNTLELPLSRCVRRDESPLSFAQIVSDFAARGLDIYLTFDPGFRFTRIDALYLVDIVGDSTGQACIGKPRTQEICATIIGDAVETAEKALKGLKGSLRGVAIDAVDLWPMGAKKRRLELTCFCESCLRYFHQRGEPALFEAFKTFPNPWNLLLAENESEDGIGFIDDVTSEASADAVLGFSRQKAYIDIFGDRPESKLRQLAALVLKYMLIRHDQTVDSLNTIFDEAVVTRDGKDVRLDRIIITEGSPYDWTSGLFLDRLDNWQKHGRRLPPCDEVWFDPTSTDLVLANVRFRSYMWRRSRYYIDAFLSFADSIGDPRSRATTALARLSEDMVRGILRDRLSTCLATATEGLAALAALPGGEVTGAEVGTQPPNQRVGFVGGALSRSVGESLVKSVDIAAGRQARG